MANAAILFPAAPLTAANSVSSEYLGPARAVAVSAVDVTVELPGGVCAPARMALAFPYEPAPGDELLVIGRGGAHYVIGVLSGAGRTALTFKGDVTVRAEGGSMELSASEGVRLRGREVEVDAGKLRMMATSVVQKFSSLVQRVSGLMSVRAQDAETLVDNTSIARAKSASILTEETMSINGKQINLG